MSRPPLTNRTAHRPQQEGRKCEGDYRGRATRKIAPTEDVANPVQGLFAKGYEPETSWSAKTDASRAVSFNTDEQSTPRGYGK